MSALLSNELSNFASFNYIWTLAVLTREEVNSGSYLGREPQYILAKTGGYTKSSQITTAAEDSLGVNVEYFVDEVEINSIYSPNPKSGITSAVKIDFKVLEPYSVGLFFQTLALASNRLGHGSSYASLPCLLRCEFLGYNSDGTVVQKIVRDLAISLVNMTFSVDAGGATYLVESIPWNQLALGDIAQKTRSDIQINGFTVEEILSSGPNSLVRYLNDYEENIRAQNNRPFSDEYIIEFPDSLGAYTPTATSTGLAAGTASINDGINLRLATAANQAAGRTVVQTSPVSSIARIGLNTIGASQISTDFNAMGNQAHGLDVVVYDKSNNTYNNNLLTIDKARNFSFRQGSRIVEMVEQVILTSEWARSIIDRLAVATSGRVDWFRVETVVNTLENGQKMQYVYKIIPYQVDRSIFEVRSQVRDYTQTLPNVKKGYNYIYTGRNTDILNFDININFAFFQNILPDSGLGANNIHPDASAALSQLGIPIVSAANALSGVLGAVTNIVNAVGDLTAQFTGNSTGTGISPSMTTSHPLPNGAGIDDAKIRIANEFHNTLLNSDIELIAIDLEVWGDPYFLPDSGMGNHVTDRGMDYQNGEIDIAFNFNTPIDIKQGLLRLNPIGDFVGLYKIIKITHTFSKGEFKQIIHMIRRPGQNENTRNAVRAMLVEYQTGVSVPSEMFINSSEVQRTSFIYNQILGSTTALTGILSRVLAFQNISNILPLPQDLINLFGTISNFGNTIVGITNNVNQIFETFNSTATQVTSAVSGIQSSFRNTVDSFNRLF
jgi:hypothetical protein